MILIRGIKGEAYARKIESGIVDCRDILSALLQPPVTGYEFSDYYEKNLVTAITSFTPKALNNLNNPELLFLLLNDTYIPHIYLTYFHVLNERSFEWLKKFDDDYQFIAVNAKIDRITQAAIGNEFYGAKMSYVSNIREHSQTSKEVISLNAACMCSIENLFEDKTNMDEPLRIYSTLSFPLFCREQDDKFTDLENEFRIIAYDCPRIQNGIRMQIPRDVRIFGSTGIEYDGTLKAGRTSLLKQKTNFCLLKNPYKTLKEILYAENGMITIDSKFKSISIKDISDDYRYLGGKKECEHFIEEMLENMPKDIFVNRTIKKEYKVSDLSNASFSPGALKLNY